MTELQKKINFVKELNDAIVKVQKNVDEIAYEVYGNSESSCYEFLVIHYKGGAYSARNCSGNSCSAIFEEIANKLNAGYYNELGFYEDTVARFKRIN